MFGSERVRHCWRVTAADPVLYECSFATQLVNCQRKKSENGRELHMFQHLFSILIPTTEPSRRTRRRTIGNNFDQLSCGKNMIDVCCDPTLYDEYIATVKAGNECQLATFATAVCCAEVLFQPSFSLSRLTRSERPPNELVTFRRGGGGLPPVLTPGLLDLFKVFSSTPS